MRNKKSQFLFLGLLIFLLLFFEIPQILFFQSQVREAQAAIGASLVTSIADNNDLSSYSFPSATYSNNLLYIAFTTSMCASGTDCGQGVDVAPTVTSVTGAGLTFTEIGTAGGLTFSTVSRRIQAWRALRQHPLICQCKASREEWAESCRVPVEIWLWVP